ncbi:MAG: RluA family pseudouridine synthase [Candidatus Heteroscillospira sp.]
MRTLSIQIPPEYEGKTVKIVLRRHLLMAESLISRIKLRERGICLNGERVKTIAMVHAGDTLSLEIGDRPGGRKVIPGAPKPDIVYEDEDLIVINKPAGLAVHGSGETGDLNVVTMLETYLNGDAVHLITRLDRGTSGLMAVAKNAYMTDRLRHIMHTPEFERVYLAWAVGTPNPPQGVITLPIAPDEDGYKRVVTPDGVYAETHYQTLETVGDLSLVRLRLVTGRTHQIRVHMAAIGCPLLGDWMYGDESPRIGRPALHSAFLTLHNPISGEWIKLSAPMPEDMNCLHNL